jgi:nitrite reductase/ring-hydroxylating ferredoxin subunit
LEWHSLGIDADAEDGVLCGVRTGGRQLIVGRVRGVWHAADDDCPHAGCAFSEDGALHDAVLVCDCHGSEFDFATGTLVRGPATEPLTCVTVRIGATGAVEAGW